VKHYTGAHAAFFEAALADFPTSILEWLAYDLPPLENTIPCSNGGIPIKSSREWLEITHGASSESLPDWCFVCDTIHGYILGGQVRDGCPLCLNTLDPERDSYLTPLLRIGWTLAEATDNKYFPELVEYLLCCHIKWREAQRAPVASSSLLSKLKG
jgi:hypothetical protein